MAKDLTYTIQDVNAKDIKVDVDVQGVKKSFTLPIEAANGKLNLINYIEDKSRIIANELDNKLLIDPEILNLKGTIKTITIDKPVDNNINPVIEDIKEG